MVEELDLETYLCISQDKVEIYLFNKKNLKNLYTEKLKINKNEFIDFKILEKFLDNNIFKIEKLSGNFVKKIFLVIENNEIQKLNFGIKKKNYKDFISKKFLQNILNDSKDLFNENYQNYHIMHIIINRYFENGNYHLSFKDSFKGDYLCVEFQFNYISNSFIFDINNVLRKYQVELGGCLDSKYIKNYFYDKQIEMSEMIYKIKNGCNENEVKIISKNTKKKGFFERFFQMFS